MEAEFCQPEEKFIFSDPKIFSLWFSGRAAIFSLLKFGKDYLGWKKAYFPSYYCHEVVHFAQSLSIEIGYYQFNPFLDSGSKDIEIEDQSGNAIINVCFFGAATLDLHSYKRSVIIDDITHDIFAYKESRADYCFGSLRKLLPLPCGGICYSPKGKELPHAECNLESDQLALQKIAAMVLKKDYLEGRIPEKGIWRDQMIDAERKFDNEFTKSGMPQVVQTIFSGLDIKAILEAKKNNLKEAFCLFKKNKLTDLLAFTNENALGLLLLTACSQEREQLKQYLISKNIFPAVLWPGQLNLRDREMETKMLFLHVDYRYNNCDMNYIVETLSQFFQ